MSEDTSLTFDEHALTLPAFKNSKALRLDMSSIREAESRLEESKTVNPVTFSELSHCFNESYRTLKRHLADIGYLLTQAEIVLEQTKSEVILGEYFEYLKDKPKSAGSTDLRNAFLIKNIDYKATLDRINQLKATQAHFDGKVKVLENVMGTMKTKMYLISRSGLGSENLYSTIGKVK